MLGLLPGRGSATTWFCTATTCALHCDDLRSALHCTALLFPTVNLRSALHCDDIALHCDDIALHCDDLRSALHYDREASPLHCPANCIPPPFFAAICSNVPRHRRVARVRCALDRTQTPGTTSHASDYRSGPALPLRKSVRGRRTNTVRPLEMAVRAAARLGHDS